MPFTTFNFGPSVCIAIPFQKRIDIISFVFVSVVIDIEPLLVMFFDLSYPLHGKIHTFIGAVLAGILLGTALFLTRKPLDSLFRKSGFKYETSIWKAVFSGIIGGFFHILMDAPLYTDIEPFYPLPDNPFYGTVSHFTMYAFSGILSVLCGFYILFKYQKKLKD